MDDHDFNRNSSRISQQRQYKSNVENAAYTERSSQRIKNHQLELARFPKFNGQKNNQNGFMKESYGTKSEINHNNQKASETYKVLQSQRV